MSCGPKVKPKVLDKDPWTAELTHLFRKGQELMQDAPDSAMLCFQRLESRSRASAFNDGIGVAMIYMGQIATNSGNNELGLAFYNKALPYCLRARHTKTCLPALYASIGAYYTLQGNYPLSSQYYYKSLQYSLKYMPGDANIGGAYLNLSAVQSRLGQFEQALYYAGEGERFVRAQKNSPPIVLAAILNNKGDAYLELHRLVDADKTLREGLGIARENKLLDVQQATLCSLGDLMLKQNKNKEAILYLKEAIGVSTKTDPYYAVILPGYGLGIAYLRLKEPDKAELVLLKALEKAEQTGQQDQSMEAHATLASVYELKGEYKDALKQQRIVVQLKDSLMNKEKVNAINEMEIKYQTAQKDKDITQKKLQISQQQNKLSRKNIWIGSSSFAAFLLSILLFNRNRINKQKRQGQEKQIRILQQQQELMQQNLEINHLKDVMQGEEKERVRIAGELHDGIVSQLMAVKLHFNGALKNAGNHIPNRPDFEHTLSYLVETTKELRITAHNLMPESVLQGGLIAALHSYCVKMSDVTTTTIHFQHYSNYIKRDPDTELSLYRMVQELVQNALKHAQANHVLVELNEEEGRISLMVEDDGVGCKEEEITSGSGMGLRNLYTRVKALKGTVHISGIPGVGTTINIELEPELIS